MWGAKPLTFQEGLPAARGAAQSPKIDDFRSVEKSYLKNLGVFCEVWMGLGARCWIGVFRYPACARCSGLIRRMAREVEIGLGPASLTRLAVVTEKESGTYGPSAP